MIKFINKILETIFPRHTTCIVCNQELSHDNDNEICANCEHDLPYVGKTCERCGVTINSMARVCNRCKNREKTFLYAISPFNYDGIAVKMVHDLKYNNKK